MPNVALRLHEHALRQPEAIAVVAPGRHDRAGRRLYCTLTFSQLDAQSDRIAAGLRQGLGIARGTRLALLQPPGLEFVVLVFGLLKAELVQILIDPGMGRWRLVRCLEEAEPQGFVGIAPVHWIRRLLGRRFRAARYNVTTTATALTGAISLAALEQLGAEAMNQHRTDHPKTEAVEAAIIFTTGSTGPPKGVLYTHDQFDHQVEQIQQRYDIRPGEIDVAGFPLFGLFNAAMGVTTVIPDMDPSRPGRVDPANIVEAVTDWQATQSFGSPAIWDRVGPYCARRSIRMSSLRRVLSAGSPVPVRVLESMTGAIAMGGQIHTPYGATEALPVATVSSAEVLGETAERSRAGGGTCVGQRFSEIEWRVIAIEDGPLPTIADTTALPRGEIGELIVAGPVVTQEYVTRCEVNSLAKIVDGERRWHRMGDVGYLDAQDRFWFCGRLAHRVVTATRTHFSVPCEAIFNNHPAVYRSALVGVARGEQIPAIVVQPWPQAYPRTAASRNELIDALRRLGSEHAHTAEIRAFFLRRSMPVDIRHNAKIFRERLAVWVAARL